MGYLSVFSFSPTSSSSAKWLQHVNLETHPCVCQLHRRKNCRDHVCLCPYFRNNTPPLVFFILHLEGQVCVLLTRCYATPAASQGCFSSGPLVLSSFLVQYLWCCDWIMANLLNKLAASLMGHNVLYLAKWSLSRLYMGLRGAASLVLQQ